MSVKKPVMRTRVRMILKFLASLERDKTGKAWTTGPEIKAKADLDMLIEDINDAIELAEKRGFVEWIQALYTSPYYFARVTITAEGRLWIENE